jgi:hypothetical protein
MNDLRILVARLGWPSTSARWWAMQELAARLGEPNAMPETDSALIQLLRSRRLEAEVVEVLFIFWIAVHAHNYVPSSELVNSIPKPSLLSDLLLASLGLSVQAGDAGLKEVPDDFEIPDDFDGVQGVDLPRIFRTSLSKLERRTGLPFVRQMAFEWTENRATYPGAPYQSDGAHFIRPLGDGFIGQLSARAALRAISAYLRALAVAKKFWNMPPELADQCALLALPVHPTLAMLRPQRPVWFPISGDFDGDAAEVEAACRGLISGVEAARPGDELISFSSPVAISMERCVEVSLVRWSLTAGCAINAIQLAAQLQSFWTHGNVLRSTATEPLGTTTVIGLPTLEQLRDNDCEAWSLAGTLDLDRMGYLQHDLYPSRLFLPTIPGLDEGQVSPRDGRLDVKSKGKVVADFCYWNAGWGPARPGPLRGNCGTALVSRGTAYREGPDDGSGSLRSFYLWQVRTLLRTSRFGEFRESLATGGMFV